MAISLPLGAGRLTRDWLTGDPPSADEVRALRKHVRAEIAAAAGERDPARAGRPRASRRPRRSGSWPGSPGPRRRARAPTSGGCSATRTSPSWPSAWPAMVVAERAELPGVSRSRAPQLAGGRDRGRRGDGPVRPDRAGDLPVGAARGRDPAPDGRALAGRRASRPRRDRRCEVSCAGASAPAWSRRLPGRGSGAAGSSRQAAADLGLRQHPDVSSPAARRPRRLPCPARAGAGAGVAARRAVAARGPAAGRAGRGGSAGRAGRAEPLRLRRPGARPGAGAPRGRRRPVGPRAGAARPRAAPRRACRRPPRPRPARVRWRAGAPTWRPPPPASRATSSPATRLVTTSRISVSRRIVSVCRESAGSAGARRRRGWRVARAVASSSSCLACALAVASVLSACLVASLTARSASAGPSCASCRPRPGRAGDRALRLLLRGGQHPLGLLVRLGPDPVGLGLGLVASLSVSAGCFAQIVDPRPRACAGPWPRRRPASGSGRPAR